MSFMAHIMKLRELIQENVPSAAGLEILEETQLRADLGLDSLRLVDFMVTLEEAYNITFDDSILDPSSLIQVGDLVNIIEKNFDGRE